MASRSRPRSDRAGAALDSAVRRLRAELDDDGADRDITTRAIVRRSIRRSGAIRAQASGVLSGVEAVARLARAVGLAVRVRRRDGARVRRGDVVLELEGDVRVLLGAERTMLNALMHLSGVATGTADAVAALRRAGGGVEVFATRKTLPGLRDLEKAAVVHGGGHPHRRDLADGYLLKSSHLTLVPMAEAVARLRRAAGPRRALEVEVRNLAEARIAIAGRAEAILIDNAGPGPARRLVDALVRERLRDRVWIEISGGITPANVHRYARTGADAVSLGALTHSARAVPFHLVLARRAPARRLRGRGRSSSQEGP